MIALAVGEANGCNYCVSAHSAIGKMVGLDEQTILLSRAGTPVDPCKAALAKFSCAVVRE